MTREHPGQCPQCEPHTSNMPIDRNLYAIIFMRDHPKATTKEFDAAWKDNQACENNQKVWKYGYCAPIQSDI